MQIFKTCDIRISRWRCSEIDKFEFGNYEFYKKNPLGCKESVQVRAAIAIFFTLALWMRCQCQETLCKNVYIYLMEL